MTEHRIDCRGGLPDSRLLRHALGRFATGVTVITTCTAGGKLEGLTANSFTAISLDPPLVLWSLQRRAPSLASFLGAESFAVNVLAAHQSHLSQHFATPRPDKFDSIVHVPGLDGCPLLEDCLARFECRRETATEGGDHIIFIGRVVHATYRDGEPLVFHAGRYCVPAELGQPA